MKELLEHLLALSSFQILFVFVSKHQ